MASLSEKSSRKLSLKKSQLASKACERGKFQEAVLMYTEAIGLDPNNHVLYTNRSAVYIKTKQFDLALEDGKRAAELQPTWQKAHFRQAVALQCMGKYHEAMAAFASAIAHDPKSQQLVAGLIDTAMKSPLKENIEKIFTRLKQVGQSPFVVVSIIGQELLNAGHIQSAIACLENALKIGTVGLRMRGSVVSALTSAYWKIGNLPRSVELMEQDLEICKSLVDHDGECRVLGNLGNAYLAMKKPDEALAAHRSQHMVASKSKDKKAAATALSSLAHVYVSMGDYPNAIDSHNKAIGFYRQLKDPLGEAHEFGCLGAVHLLAGDCGKSIRCHEDQLKLAKNLNNDMEVALAYGNLGSAHNQKGSFKEAAELHGQVLRIAETIADATLEGRACAGLGRAYRSMGNLAKALKYYERQQGVAVKLKDRVLEGRALSSLGIIYLEQGECLHALKLHKVHLAICQEFSDRAGQGQAYGNMGCAYSALKKYEQAIKFHQMELDISKEVNDLTSEACTHGNLAVAYQGLGNSDEARRHYEQHLAISRGNGDTYNEGVALFNLGNFYSSSGNFRKAIAYYEKYLSLTQTKGDKIGENKACHNLAFAHFSLRNLEEAVKLYERNIELALAVDDKNTLARAYCNLGLIKKDLGDFQNSLTCQNNFQSVSQEIGHLEGECRALGNIGDIYVKTKRVREAVGYYEKQLRSAERLKDKTLLCQAYGALGHVYKILGKLDKAMTCHSKALKVHRDLNDVVGLFKALDHIGTDCSASGKHDEAMEYFSEQRRMADRAKDVHMQGRALGNLGLAKLNSGEYRDAMRYFNSQIELLQQIAPAGSLELGRAQGNLAECLFMVGDHERAKGNYELFLTAAKAAAVPSEQDKAYRGLGNTYRALGNLQQALFCFENRLVFAHELTEGFAKSSAYGELGNLHRAMGNHEQAATCYSEQLKLAKEYEDVESESDAECGLGEVHCKLGDYETAITHHENDLRLGDKLQSSMRQSRAFGNLGLVYELLQNYKKASECQEQHLSLAAQVSDRVAKVDAYSSLGRNHYCMANFAQSISYLKQGLTIAETLGRSEDEATIRYWLGVALCAKKEIASSLEQLYKAAELYECLRDAGIASGRFHIPMHEQQSLCYQVLQRVLIDQGRHEEALVVAERARARDFIDFFLRKQGVQPPADGDSVTVNSYDQIMEVVNKQNGYFICYSLVLGYVCIWLVVPQHGIVKFHELRLSEDMPELMVHTDSGFSGTSATWSVLERLIGQIREDIGVEPACGSSVSTLSSSLSGSDIDEPWERGSFDGTNTRPRRSSDNASVSSMPATLSYLKNGLLKKGLRKLNGVRVDSRKDWLTKPPVQVLYETLIAPVEEFLPQSPQADGSLSDVILVPQGDLYLVPFSLLKNHSKDHLHKRFSLITVPSIYSLLLGQRSTFPEKPSATRLVVGDPQLPLSLDNYRCNSSVEYETELVGTLFGTKPLVGSDASKAMVCRKVEDAECIHFATNTSWKHSALVLSPNKVKGHNGTQRDSESSENFMPSPVDFLLTAPEICQMRLPAKLVVLGCGQNETRNKMTLDGLMGLVRSFLLAGVSCLLLSLWPVPEPAYKLLLQGFYKRFLRGMRASRALAHAVKLVESNKEFAHPSNWAGFILVGGDVKVSKKTVQLREALTLIIESTVHCREALKVILHLVDKANQRLLDNNTSMMYTAEASVENKLGDAQGWRDVLQSAGFRFRKAAKSLPDAIFFPVKDDKGKLRQCGDILRALLGLSPTTLQAISKVLFSPSLVKALLELFNSVLSSFAKGLNNVQVPLQLTLWRVTGCHELLASMGFDLLGVGKDEVMLRSGAMNGRRVLQCAVVALNTLTGGLGTDKTEINGVFPLRRSGSDSSLKSSVSTISSFSYASADRTIEAKSYHGSSRRSHVSDVDTILDDLEMCQEESSVDPEVNEDIPINTESRALFIDKKPRVRFSETHETEPSESSRSHSSHVGNDSSYEPFGNNNTLLPPEVEGVNGRCLSTTSNGVALDSGSQGQAFINIPRPTNGHSNGVESWESGAMMAKSPVIDKTSYQHPSYFRDYSDSVDSETSLFSATAGDDERKTPGSINSMHQQRRVNGGVSLSPHQDSSPQMRREKFRRGNPVLDSELDLSRDSEPVPLRSRSVSLESGVDDVDGLNSENQRDNPRCGHRSNDVEIFHAVIQNKQLRGSRKENTRGGNFRKTRSKSEDMLLSSGGSSPARVAHEPSEIFSMDTDTSSVLSDGSHGVNGEVSLANGSNGFQTSKQITRPPYGSQKDSRRKLKSDHLANLKNLQASAC